LKSRDPEHTPFGDNLLHIL